MPVEEVVGYLSLQNTSKGLFLTCIFFVIRIIKNIQIFIFKFKKFKQEFFKRSRKLILSEYGIPYPKEKHLCEDGGLDDWY